MAHIEIDSTDSRKRWRARNVDKDAAHRAVEFFVRKLRRRGLSVPNCESCGKTEGEVKADGRKIHAHHSDYSRPLDVVWLCDHCHIVDHWRTSWKAERNGRAVKLIQTTVVVQEDAS